MKHEAIALNPQSGIAVFTDGSCSYKDKVGGWAWVALDGFGSRPVVAAGAAHDTTTNRMELEAVIQALDYLEVLIGSGEILVFSDSNYVVLGASDPTRARRKNVDLWEYLDDSISRHEYVEFEHVKGHSNNPYNDLADKLAGGARKSECGTHTS